MQLKEFDFHAFTGVSKRKCLENGVWGYPDYGACTSKEFNELKEKVCHPLSSSVYLPFG